MWHPILSRILNCKDSPSLISPVAGAGAISWCNDSAVRMMEERSPTEGCMMQLILRVKFSTSVKVWWFFLADTRLVSSLQAGAEECSNAVIAWISFINYSIIIPPYNLRQVQDEDDCGPVFQINFLLDIMKVGWKGLTKDWTYHSLHWYHPSHPIHLSNLSIQNMTIFFWKTPNTISLFLTIQWRLFEICRLHVLHESNAAIGSRKQIEF